MRSAALQSRSAEYNYRNHQSVAPGANQTDQKQETQGKECSGPIEKIQGDRYPQKDPARQGPTPTSRMRNRYASGKPDQEGQVDQGRHNAVRRSKIRVERVPVT
jgi:hypothetical protein